MSGKTCPSEYKCICGFIQSGIGLHFCGRCGNKYNVINGEEIYIYINKCQCSGDDIDKICVKCGSQPTPMHKDQFLKYKDKINTEHHKITAISNALRYKNNALNRLLKRKNGINCTCTTGCICKLCDDFD